MQNTAQSKYWKDMHIVNDKTTEENAENDTHKINQILTREEPIDFASDYSDLDWTCYHPYSIDVHDDINDELVKFVNKHNKVPTGIYELITPGFFKTFTGIESYLGVIRYNKTNKIMGVMISLILNTTALNTTKFALTTYLCVHTQLRKKGLCMMLIRKMIKEAHTNGMLCSYYLQASPFSQCALPVERWMRPINVTRALERGFEFIMPSDKNSIKYKHAYHIGNQLDNGYKYNVIKINKEINESYAFITLFNDRTDKPAISWKPSKKEWKTWCISDAMDTLLIKDRNGSIQGIVTLQKKQIYIPETDKLADLTFIPYHIALSESDHNQILNAAVIYSKKLDMDMMFMFENGVFTRDVIIANKAGSTGEMYIDFYNFNNKLSIKDVYVPLL